MDSRREIVYLVILLAVGVWAANARRAKSRFVTPQIDPDQGYCLGELSPDYGRHAGNSLMDLVGYVKRPPKYLNRKAQQLLGEICSPWDYETYHYGSCCDLPALMEMEKIFQIFRAVFEFDNCPSCYWNMRIFTCGILCSPKQSKFIRVDETNTTEAGKEVWKKVTFFMDRDHFQASYDSCNSTRTSDGELALQKACKSVIGTECGSLEQTIALAGRNSFSHDFDMVMDTTGSEVVVNGTVYQPLLNPDFYDVDVVACDESIPDDVDPKPACPCYHCKRSCPAEKKKMVMDLMSGKGNGNPNESSASDDEKEGDLMEELTTEVSSEATSRSSVPVRRTKLRKVVRRQRRPKTAEEPEAEKPAA